MNDLKRDKVVVLRCWLAMGGKEDVLRRRYRNRMYDYYWRDEPSDDVSQWLGVKVEGGRVTVLEWNWGECTSWPSQKREQDPHRSLTGAIPAEMWMLDGLTELSLGENFLCGHLPSEIGRLTSLKRLMLYSNNLEGPLPAELGALTALERLGLDSNNFTGELPYTLANLTNMKWLWLGSPFESGHLVNSDNENKCKKRARKFLSKLGKAACERCESLKAECEKLKVENEKLKAKYEPDL